jgi:hypothetical protein
MCGLLRATRPSMEEVESSISMGCSTPEAETVIRAMQLTPIGIGDRDYGIKGPLTSVS